MSDEIHITHGDMSAAPEAKRLLKEAESNPNMIGFVFGSGVGYILCVSFRREQSIPLNHARSICKAMYEAILSAEKLTAEAEKKPEGSP